MDRGQAHTFVLFKIFSTNTLLRESRTQQHLHQKKRLTSVIFWSLWWFTHQSVNSIEKHSLWNLHPRRIFFTLLQIYMRAAHKLSMHFPYKLSIFPSNLRRSAKYCPFTCYSCRCIWKGNIVDRSRVIYVDLRVYAGVARVKLHFDFGLNPSS